MDRPIASAIVGLALALTLLAATHRARADKDIGKLTLQGVCMVTRHHDAPMSVAADQSEPDVLARRNVRLKDEGMLVGGGLLGSMMLDGTRAGLGVSFFGVQDTGMTLGALPAGYQIGGGRLWGVSFEARLGREFQLGPLFPYVDLRLAFLTMAVNTRLSHEPEGVLGNTQYGRSAFGLGPVGGLFFPMGEYFFFDISGYAGLLGDEKYGGFGGFGIWTPHFL